VLTLAGQVDTAGLHVHAGVRIVVATTLHAYWSWDIARDPIDLTVDFSCRRDTALVHVTGPTYVTTTIARAQQDSRVCNPPPRWSPFALKIPSVPIAMGLVLLGWVLHP